MLMHNGRLANPLDEHSIAVSDAVKAAKKGKTRKAWDEAYYAEFLGGLYFDEVNGPCLPGELLEAVIVEGAKRTKQGKQAKAAIIVDGNFALAYKGPRNPEGMWKAKLYRTQSVKVIQSRVMRTRPCFEDWACEFDVDYNPQLVSKKDITAFLSTAGREVGLGDRRPRYGRFEVRS